MIRKLIDRTIDFHARVLLSWASDNMEWALMRLARRYPMPKDILRTKVRLMIGTLQRDVEQLATFYESEVQIQTRRLGRRYDPGMALNEATERALKAKALTGRGDGAYAAHAAQQTGAAALTSDPAIKLDGSDASWAALAKRQRDNPDLSINNHPTLLPQQEAALEFQKNSARQNVERSQSKGDFQ